jgi:hypothetical protein
LSFQNLFVANAGLGNGIARDEVVNIFKSFGIVENIVMIVKKPYAFVCYKERVAAEKAHEMINGKPLKCPEEVSSKGLHFYTAYVENGMECVQIIVILISSFIYLNLMNELYITEDVLKLLSCMQSRK